MSTVKALGGLFRSLRPNEEVALKDTDYVIRNVGPITAKVQVYLASKRDAINQALENDLTNPTNQEHINGK